MRKLTNFHIKLGKLALILALLLIGGQVWGATYYVSNSQSNGYEIGVDANSTAQAQSKATPWLTMMGAEAKASNGDIIYVNAGTYAEAGGTFGTFEPAKALTWIADGTAIIRAATYATAAMRPTATATMSFTGFTIDAQGTKTTCVYSGVASNLSFTSCIFSGATGYLIGATTGVATNLTDCTLTASAGSVFNNNTLGIVLVRPTITLLGTATGIAAFTADNSTFSCTGPGTITIGAGGGFSFGGGGTATYSVTGMTININANIAQLLYGAGAGKTNSITFSTNTVSLNSANTVSNYIIGILQGSCTFTMNGNTITNNNTSLARQLVNIDAGEAGSAHTSSITNNIITNLSAVTGANVSTCINAANTSTGTSAITISGNTITSNVDSGYIIFVGTEATGANNDKISGTVTGNALYGQNRASLVNANPVVHGIFVGFNKGFTVSRNLVHGAAYGAVMKHSAAAEGTQGLLTYNVFRNCKWGVYSKGYAQLGVYGNTIYSTLEYGNTTDSPYGIRVDKNGGTASENMFLKNNLIVISNVGVTPTGIFLSDAAVPAGFECDYNGVFFTANGNYATQNATAYANLAAFQAIGYDTNSPSIASIPLDGLTLVPIGKAIGSGVLITGYHDQATPATDYAGVDVTWGPSIGAYQPTGTAPTWASLNGAKLLRASQAVTITGDHSAETLDLSNAANTGTLTVSGQFSLGKVIGNAAVPIVASPGAKITAPIELGNNAKLHGFQVVHE